MIHRIIDGEGNVLYQRETHTRHEMELARMREVRHLNEHLDRHCKKKAVTNTIFTGLIYLLFVALVIMFLMVTYELWFASIK